METVPVGSSLVLATVMVKESVTEAVPSLAVMTTLLAPTSASSGVPVSTPVPEAHQDAARAQGKARFEQFVEQLGRHLLRGRSLVRNVVEELHPDPVRMDDATALAEAHERTAERAL